MKNQSTKLKISILVPAIILSAFLFSGCDKKTEEVIQNNNTASEVQNKIDEQQAQIDELQKFKDEQQQKEYQAKKDDCELRLKTAQGYLASSQKWLTEEQEALRIAEAGDCQDCYKQCMKNYGCDGEKEDDETSNCDANKKKCKEKDASNLKNRQSDVAQDTASVKKHTASIQAIKDECAQYLN